MKNQLQSFEQKNELLPFQIIDRIYALDPTYWTAYLRRLAEILSEDRPLHEELTRLNEEVIDFLFKSRGRLMKMAVVSEKKKIKKAV